MQKSQTLDTTPQFSIWIHEQKPHFTQFIFISKNKNNLQKTTSPLILLCTYQNSEQKKFPFKLWQTFDLKASSLCSRNTSCTIKAKPKKKSKKKGRRGLFSSDLSSPMGSPLKLMWTSPSLLLPSHLEKSWTAKVFLRNTCFKLITC